jgi:hypothetical protein
MKKHILFLIIGWVLSGSSMADNAFKFIPEDWKQTQEKVLSLPSGFEALNQDPFPLCFAVTASTLIDLINCKNGECNKENRVSFLSLAKYGGKAFPLETSKNVYIPESGSTLATINYLKKGGKFSKYKNCNYEKFTNKLKENKSLTLASKNEQFNEIFKQYKKYYKYNKYLTIYYTRLWLEEMKFWNPDVSEAKALSFLSLNTAEQAKEELIHTYCEENLQVTQPNNFEIKSIKIDPVKIKDIEKVIDNNLDKKIFTAITFCFNETLDKACKTSHIVIITGKSIYTKEDKSMKAYKILNTWGQEWQNNNKDGWIEASNFLSYTYGELIWLVKK